MMLDEYNDRVAVTNLYRCVWIFYDFFKFSASYTQKYEENRGKRGKIANFHEFTGGFVQIQPKSGEIECMVKFDHDHYSEKERISAKNG